MSILKPANGGTGEPANESIPETGERVYRGTGE